MDGGKFFVISFLCFLGIFGGVRIGDYIIANYQYENTISANWSLAEKASTLDQKADYIDKFRNTLIASNMGGSYNAIWLKTPDNSFDRNFEALTSLQSRMTEIRGMDVKSFEYQQAISQITAQEEGEAGDMLNVFKGCWYMTHHFWLWDWINVTINISIATLFVIFIFILLPAYFS